MYGHNANKHDKRGLYHSEKKKKKKLGGVKHIKDILSSHPIDTVKLDEESTEYKQGYRVAFHMFQGESKVGKGRG